MATFLEVLVGTLIWMASSLPGVWLEAIREALTGQTLVCSLGFFAGKDDELAVKIAVDTLPAVC